MLRWDNLVPGESDAKPELAPSYQKRFSRILKRWREISQNPALPIITVQLNRVRGNDNDDLSWTQVREAQRQIARDNDYVAIVPSADLPLCDQIHTSSAGNLTLGRRCAQAALAIAYGRTAYWPAPQASTAERLEGNRIRISFDYVNDAFQNGLSSRQTAELFHIEGRDGKVYAIEEARLGSDTIEITTTETVPDEVIISILYGSDPASRVPITVPSYLPILAVHGLKLLKKDEDQDTHTA